MASWGRLFQALWALGCISWTTGPPKVSWEGHVAAAPSWVSPPPLGPGPHEPLPLLPGDNVRCRGLPFQSSEEDVLEFFGGLQVLDVVLPREGAPPGAAWVLLSSLPTDPSTSRSAPLHGPHSPRNPGPQCPGTLLASGWHGWEQQPRRACASLDARVLGWARQPSLPAWGLVLGDIRRRSQDECSVG